MRQTDCRNYFGTGVVFLEPSKTTDYIQVEKHLLLSKVIVSYGFVNVGSDEVLAMEVGTTPLNLAVAIDVEIVKILLENGADPNIENDLGMNALDICEKFGPYPRIKTVY